MADAPALQHRHIHPLAHAYGLTVTGFAPMAGGASNTSYRLHTPDGDVVLTVFNEKTGAEVRQVAHLLVLLEAHRFPTTRVCRTTTGELLTWHRDKPVLVKPYIDGQVCETLTDAMLRQTGAALARLHQVPAPTALPGGHPYGLHLFARALAPDLDAAYAAWLTRQHAIFTEHLPTDLPRALLHGDLFYDNVLFDRQDFRAIIDFEEACHYARIFDVGMAMVGLCAEGATLALDKARALAQGYEAVQPLETREQAALQRFAEYAATATSAWRFWKYNLRDPDPARHAIHWPMAHLADAIRAIPAGHFVEQVFQYF